MLADTATAATHIRVQAGSWFLLSDVEYAMWYASDLAAIAMSDLSFIERRFPFLMHDMLFGHYAE